MKTRQLISLFYVALLLVSACSKQEEKDLVTLQVYTLQLNDITDTEATLRLNCIMDRQEAQSLGFKWKKKSDSNFTIATVTVKAEISTLTIKDLEEDTEYVFKAFVVAPSGDTLFGKDVSFLTHSTMTDIDGNVYFTMRYGDKVWMTDNLRVTRYADGTPIEARTGGYASYNDGPVYYYTQLHTTDLRNPNFGLLYNWAAAVRAESCDTLMDFPPEKNVQGICPDGWHIPSLSELYSISSRYKGSEMKTNNWGMEGACTSNNYSQFSAEPAGYFYYNTGENVFRSVGSGAFFWTKTQVDPTLVWSYFLYSGDDPLYEKKMLTIIGYSIRCVKD